MLLKATKLAEKTPATSLLVRDANGDSEERKAQRSAKMLAIVVALWNGRALSFYMYASPGVRFPLVVVIFALFSCLGKLTFHKVRGIGFHTHSCGSHVCRR